MSIQDLAVVDILSSDDEGGPQPSMPLNNEQLQAIIKTLEGYQQQMFLNSN